MPSVQINIGGDVIAALASSLPDAVVTMHLVLHLPPQAQGGGADASTGGGDRHLQPTPSSPVLARGPLADLLRGGVLSVGDRLRLHQPRARRTAYATVQADGTVLVDGHNEGYSSPSAAAAFVTGSQINGWASWQRESDGQTLHQLRMALRGTVESS